MLWLDRLILSQGAFRMGANWSADAGDRIAVIGPSGAGKSTLLLAIAGFIQPEQGRILWEGQDLGPLSPGQRPVSILFQDQNLFPHLSLIENLGLGLSPSLRPKASDAPRIEAALARMGLGGLGGRKPGEVSGGQQGRAALARVLLRSRPILLLDEPFAAFGPALKSEMLDLVAEVADETRALVMMVTHDPQDAKRFARKVVLVSGGQAEPPRETEALFADPPDTLRDYLGG
jgi:thiamine transport system ATP-binding protein